VEYPSVVGAIHGRDIPWCGLSIHDVGHPWHGLSVVQPIHPWHGPSMAWAVHDVGYPWCGLSIHGGGHPWHGLSMMWAICGMGLDSLRAPCPYARAAPRSSAEELGVGRIAHGAGLLACSRRGAALPQKLHLRCPWPAPTVAARGSMGIGTCAGLLSNPFPNDSTQPWASAAKVAGLRLPPVLSRPGCAGAGGAFWPVPIRCLPSPPSEQAGALHVLAVVTSPGLGVSLYLRGGILGSGHAVGFFSGIFTQEISLVGRGSGTLPPAPLCRVGSPPFPTSQPTAACSSGLFVAWGSQHPCLRR